MLPTQMFIQLVVLYLLYHRDKLSLQRAEWQLTKSLGYLNGDMSSLLE